MARQASNDSGNGQDNVVIRVRGVRNQFGTQVVHDNLDLDVMRGEVLGLVGASGAGKSVLMRTIIGLNKKAAGTIEVLGRDTDGLSEREWVNLQENWGVLFQDGALFSSLTVAQNIQVPMKEHTNLSKRLMDELAAVKIEMVGLAPDAGAKYPSELSGGMRKRAGLARSLSLDPDILFLDEPTAGLDPVSASAFDDLIRSLQQSLDLTVVMVTHDLDSLAAICDRIACLVDKRVKVAPMQELMKDPNPWIQEYFHGPRGRAAISAKEKAQRGASGGTTLQVG